VRALAGRFNVDLAQAERVEATALEFLRQCGHDWSLHDDPFAERVLGWAARLHEVGLDISHSHYHRHGAYLLQNADLPGFPHHEQQILAALVGNHRRKLQPAMLEDLMPPWHVRSLSLIVLLRLAVLLHRGRAPRAVPALRLGVKGKVVDLQFPRGWLAEHPLTAADLEQEAQWLEAAGIRLRAG
jgi:exopolyphosphatase/guanosine-5'-triphosphate,3'-diphosphate pyrophosphatase